MLGPIIGDVVGSVYEYANIKREDFPLFKPSTAFTDDTVMTAAVANAVLSRPAGADEKVTRHLYATKLRESCQSPVRMSANRTRCGVISIFGVNHAIMRWGPKKRKETVDGFTMNISQHELAERIRRARVAAGLTQDDLARVLGLSRSAVAQIEASNRKVDSIELSRIARFVGRAVGDFLAPEFQEDGVAVILRALAEARQDPKVQEELSRSLTVARQIVALEEILGLVRLGPALPRYGEPVPTGVWEAVLQGERLAGQERHRLQLGTDPIGDLAGMLENHGVLVLEVALPEAVSGFTFRFEKDLACGVNLNHCLGRRRYSLAHELCHALCDVGPADGTVSNEGGKDPRETRANAFAAAFLLPADSVLALLAGTGKGHPAAIATEAGPVRRREPAGKVDLWDVIGLARYFGVTREAAIWRLRSLRLIDEAERAQLAAQAKSGLGARLERRLNAVEREEKPDEESTLRCAEKRLFFLALEALTREEISRRKFIELAALAGLSEEEIDEIPPARRIYE